MKIMQLSKNIDPKKYLKELGVDGGGVSILASKMDHHIISICDLSVGAANILKQDALSIGADLAVPRGTVIAATPRVDCILIATTRQLEVLSKKELAQPFELNELAKKLKELLSITKPKFTEIMGVINANDDSFYQGSRFKDTSAIDAINKMIEDGADIIDIGGVSSKPNSFSISPSEELNRVKQIFDAIREQKLYETVRFSCDSYEPKVISYALESGFKIVNDITGLENDAVCKLCSEYEATAVIMHMQGRPKTMQDAPSYENVVVEVYDFLQERALKAESFGVKDIVLDVGIGFGKTLEHNLMLIKHLENFLTLGYPLLVGASRKSMIDKMYPSSANDRLSGTLTLHLEALKNGASILRVHDVKEHKQAIEVYKALEKI